MDCRSLRRTPIRVLSSTFDNHFPREGRVVQQSTVQSEHDCVRAQDSDNTVLYTPTCDDTQIDTVSIQKIIEQCSSSSSCFAATTRKRGAGSTIIVYGSSTRDTLALKKRNKAMSLGANIEPTSDLRSSRKFDD